MQSLPTWFDVRWIIMVLLVLLLTSGCAHVPERQVARTLPTLYVEGADPRIWVGGFSIVEGLDGTGDGDWYYLRRMLAGLYPGRQFGAEELTSLAVVMVTGKVRVPIEAGAAVEIDVSPIFTATHLAGGKLVRCSLGAIETDDVLRVSAAGDVVPSVGDPDGSTGGHVVQAGRVVVPPARPIVPSPHDGGPGTQADGAG